LIRSAIEAGLDVNIRDSLGITPLIDAVNKGNLELMDKLIKAGAGLDVRDSDGWTPAMHAIHKGNIEAMDMLANARAASLAAAAIANNAGSKRRREEPITPAENRKRLAGLVSLRGALDAIRRAKQVPERKKKKGISKL
jgi:ankyrin repeat protein